MDKTVVYFLCFNLLYCHHVSIHIHMTGHRYVQHTYCTVQYLRDHVGSWPFVQWTSVYCDVSSTSRFSQPVNTLQFTLLLLVWLTCKEMWGLTFLSVYCMPYCVYSIVFFLCRLVDEKVVILSSKCHNNVLFSTFILHPHQVDFAWSAFICLKCRWLLPWSLVRASYAMLSKGQMCSRYSPRMLYNLDTMILVFDSS